MSTAIYDHDNDLDLMHKMNTIELDNWINHLVYIKKELQSIIGLCDENVSETLNDNDTISQFNEKDVKNEALLVALRKYMNSRDYIVECDDTQCDMAFVAEHESYRRNYLNHLDEYRKLKDAFYSKMQGKISLSA
ncbi:hypothetical protein SCB49_02274 [unidentified eubacterium SCB49]|nr:hypothetical protein SCB49_02274 [unidentified eubacterium SCB49]